MSTTEKQSAIEASTNLNALLLQSMVEGMILQDGDGRIIQFNQAALDILGVTEAHLLLQDYVDIQIPDKIFPGKNHIGMKSLQTGQTQRNIILSIFRLDGEMRWISLNSVPIFDKEKNKMTQLISTFTDITETKKNLNDLKQVQLLFNISHDLTVITNKEGYFKKINPRFQEVLGHSFKEIVSQKFINFIHPEDVELTQIELKQALEKKDSVHFINRYKTKAGDYRVFDWVVVPDKETNLVYFTARDITDYRAEELDLIHSSKVYTIGEMTSGIAYAIHSELAIMAGHISNIQGQLEKENMQPEEIKKKIFNVEESINRLIKTTKGLTVFARNTENEPFLEIPLNKVLDTAVGLCKERFRVHGVRLDIKLSEDVTIKCRETQLTQVFVTLLNNAYDEVHTMRDSWVQLIGHEQGHVIKIYISNCADKPKEIDPKQFSVSQGIIEENFGRFHIEQIDPHTKFVLEFPLIEKITELNLN
ncbi:PAS domain S-box protein [Bacteriovorax sp. PP10]|uniref:histidine kinase n=1 Tax=Bacteriovorax antarcticus TaxID=3088717 RepID=A0ABU5VSB2_9BACT|nr:PAS domain S-box protein [Bacteriovorax sp. PP10]MEA9355891.1 PAS domain S-box protein [Bacteriovorax sp. PP10]